MPASNSSNNATAIRRRRPNRPNRQRMDLLYVIDHPTYTNIYNYAKYFMFKSRFGRFTSIFLFLGIIHICFFAQNQWPKFVRWLHNSTEIVTNEY